jgi:hypothetical protein
MALNLITNIGTELTLSSQWGDLSTLLDQVKTGIGNKIRVHSLTNWDSSTTKPAIAEGSLFDVGGSLYLANSDTALTDESGLIDGTCHIKLVPAVDGLTVVPTLTNDSIPAWDETKHGWYDADDSFLPYEFTKASAVYSEKKEYTNQDKTISEDYDGSLNIPGGVSCSSIDTGDGPVTFNQETRTDSSVVFNKLAIDSDHSGTFSNSSLSGDIIYDTLAAKFSSGQYVMASGIIDDIILSSFIMGSSSMSFFGANRTAGTYESLTINNGSSVTHTIVMSYGLVIRDQTT